MKVDLYREKPKEENLDDIFGEGRKGQEQKAVDNTKKEETVVAYKKQPEVKVSTKFKDGKPLI